MLLFSDWNHIQIILKISFKPHIVLKYEFFNKGFFYWLLFFKYFRKTPQTFLSAYFVPVISCKSRFYDILYVFLGYILWSFFHDTFEASSRDQICRENFGTKMWVLRLVMTDLYRVFYLYRINKLVVLYSCLLLH